MFVRILFVAVAFSAMVGAKASEVLDSCVISNCSGRAEISLVGARVMSWRDAMGKELLFMPVKKSSDGAEWSHGGIPLCWPWFGRKEGVIHGFVRTKRFSVVKQGEDDVRLRYVLAEGEEPAFPHAATIEVDLRLAKGLSIALRICNAGVRPFDFTCGIHPYFAVTDYAGLSFYGVDNAPFDCVDGMDKAFSRSSDGCFCLADKASLRTLSLKATGNSHVIVWTPGNVEPPNRNLKREDMARFIGFGPAVTKAAGPIILLPGKTYEMKFDVSVARMSDRL